MKKTYIRTNAILAAAIVAAVAGAVSVPAMAGPPAAPQTPVPKILVIDRDFILRTSKVGQDAMRQGKALADQARNEFKGQNDGLMRERQALQQQTAILAPAAKQKKMADFAAKVAAFQKRIDDREKQIEGGMTMARIQIANALDPILVGIMKERGANLLMDRNAIVRGLVDVDISRLAVQRLDQKMPTIKVVLYKPPAGGQPGK